ncbi:MAG TPA: hypothetical protein VI412_00495, partial [Tabrizicola sp.]
MVSHPDARVARPGQTEGRFQCRETIRSGSRAQCDAASGEFGQEGRAGEFQPLGVDHFILVE